MPGIERVRFVTSHPRYMSDGVIAAVAECPKLMPVFHIPAQSGDDEVLRRMGRGYTAERYLEIVAKIRKAIPRMRDAVDAPLFQGHAARTLPPFATARKRARRPLCAGARHHR